MEFNYNYVYFNAPDGGPFQVNPDGYFYTCLNDLRSKEGIRVMDFPLDYAPFIIKLMYKMHMSSHLHLPFKNIWYPFYFKNNFKVKKPICFIISHYVSIEYLQYLRKKFPDAVFVKFLRDLVHTQQEKYDNLRSTGLIDYWISYDECEASKYGMLYHNEIESTLKLRCKPDIEYDVFFAGKAKDRLAKLVSIYDKLTTCGLKCYFYITHIPSEKRILRDGIEYSDTFMSYKDMLMCNMKSRCILEIGQENAVGYTSRYLEAVIYNKRLLSDFMGLKNTKFYNPNYIQCFESVNDIDVSFITNEEDVDFHYNNEFSPLHLIQFIDEFLAK